MLYSGSFAGAEDDLELVGCGFRSRELIHRFTLTEAADVSVVTSGGTTYLQSAIATTCPTSMPLLCAGGAPARNRARGLLPGDYYVIVEATRAGGYSVQVDATSPPVASGATRAADTADAAATEADAHIAGASVANTKGVWIQGGATLNAGGGFIDIAGRGGNNDYNYGVYDSRIHHKHPDRLDADPWHFLFLVNPVSRAVLMTSVTAPPLGKFLSRAAYKTAETVGALHPRLERLAIAGATLSYGLEYFRGVREEAGSLRKSLRDLGAHAVKHFTKT
jgi:hypothetical protein